MKKFGTPIGAAPGSASETVGFSSVGEPSGGGRGGGCGVGAVRQLALDLLRRRASCRRGCRRGTSGCRCGGLPRARRRPAPGVGLRPEPGFALLPRAVAVALGCGAAVGRGRGRHGRRRAAHGRRGGRRRRRRRRDGPRSTTGVDRARAAGAARRWLTEVPAGTSTVSSIALPVDRASTVTQCERGSAEARRRRPRTRRRRQAR